MKPLHEQYRPATWQQSVRHGIQCMIKADDLRLFHGYADALLRQAIAETFLRQRANDATTLKFRAWKEAIRPA